MSITLPLKSGGVFQAEAFVFDQTIASGQTGDLVTIGTAGKITRLTLLISETAASQPGISINKDGTLLVSEKTLSQGSPTPISSQFFVAPSVGTDIPEASGGNVLDVFGEFLTIIKNAGNTTESIKYSYETGVIVS